jgi:hypothetical protein
LICFSYERKADDPFQKGPWFTLICDQKGNRSPEVAISALLLARFSTIFKNAILRRGYLLSYLGPEENNIGRFELSGFDEEVVSMAVRYLKGSPLIISSEDGDGDAISRHTLKKVVQLSSFAHVFGIQQLQDNAMHSLWHYLITMRMNIDKTEMRALAHDAAPECPARRLLEAMIASQHDVQNQKLLRLHELLKIQTNGPDFQLAKDTLEAAVNDTKQWVKIQLSKYMIVSVCDNRSDNGRTEWSEKLEQSITEAYEWVGLNGRRPDPHEWGVFVPR